MIVIYYHTMDILGYGKVSGEWDLRGRDIYYLGNAKLQGKRVLEIGTASGHRGVGSKYNEFFC
jgi:hypothetical protein